MCDFFPGYFFHIKCLDFSGLSFVLTCFVASSAVGNCHPAQAAPPFVQLLLSTVNQPSRLLPGAAVLLLLDLYVDFTVVLHIATAQITHNIWPVMILFSKLCHFLYL